MGYQTGYLDPTSSVNPRQNLSDQKPRITR